MEEEKKEGRINFMAEPTEKAEVGDPAAWQSPPDYYEQVEARLQSLEKDVEEIKQTILYMLDPD